MENLDKIYQTQLDNIKASIQNSDLLTTYLEEEEEEHYKALADFFEPQIQELYLKVADHHPLQLVALENELLDPAFEGLYIPKILGYSVLRGYVNENNKYYRPQDHFSDVLETIINSSNFEMISKRIGQSVQIGFALSSDIWITNIINTISNKKVKYFLQSQKLEKYRNPDNRRIGLIKYRRQFQSLNYQSTEFPDTVADLQAFAPSIKEFLLYRSDKNYDNSSLHKHLNDFIKKEEFMSHPEFLELLMVTGMFIDLDESITANYTKAFNKVRNELPNFESEYFRILNDLQHGDHVPGIDEDKRISALIDKSEKGEVSSYYQLMDTVHGKGYINDEAIEAVRNYYYNHEGRSIENECIRSAIFNYFSRFLNNLEPEAYHDYFEINKVFTQYISTFSNQKFNQNVKAISLRYVKKLLKRFTDKRGKDYQDIKKWVKTTFLDLGFMKEKELVELFKTKRKKRVAK